MYSPASSGATFCTMSRCLYSANTPPRTRTHLISHRTPASTRHKGTESISLLFVPLRARLHGLRQPHRAHITRLSRSAVISLNHRNELDLATSVTVLARESHRLPHPTHLKAASTLSRRKRAPGRLQRASARPTAATLALHPAHATRTSQDIHPPSLRHHRGLQPAHSWLKLYAIARLLRSGRRPPFALLGSSPAGTSVASLLIQDSKLTFTRV